MTNKINNSSSPNKLKQERELAHFFKLFKKQEPEVADAALKLFDGNVINAANFLNKPATGLNEKTPIEIIDSGKRSEVIEFINRNEYTMGL